MNTVSAKIGQLISGRRQSLGIRQVDFAELAGVAVHTVSDIESGVGNPTLDILLKVLDPLVQTVPGTFEISKEGTVNEVSDSKAREAPGKTRGLCRFRARLDQQRLREMQQVCLYL